MTTAHVQQNEQPVDLSHSARLSAIESSRLRLAGGAVVMTPRTDIITVRADVFDARGEAVRRSLQDCRDSNAFPIRFSSNRNAYCITKSQAIEISDVLRKSDDATTRSLAQALAEHAQQPQIEDRDQLIAKVPEGDPVQLTWLTASPQRVIGGEPTADRGDRAMAPPLPDDACALASR